MIDESQQLWITAGLGFRETVFVSNAATGVLRLYTPTGELPFAGHPRLAGGWHRARAMPALNPVVFDIGPRTPCVSSKGP